MDEAGEPVRAGHRGRERVAPAELPEVVGGEAARAVGDGHAVRIVATEGPGDRLADLGEQTRASSAGATAAVPGPADLLGHTDTIRFRVCDAAGGQLDAWISVVTGDVRQVRDIDVWVNSENSSMEMSRVEDYSISAAIRYEGADRDGFGRVVDDRIAVELAGKVAGRTPATSRSACPTPAGRASTTSPSPRPTEAASRRRPRAQASG